MFEQNGLLDFLQQAGQTFSALENKPLEHLSALAGASPLGAQLYGGAYGGALANLADPVGQQYKQALIQQANDPLKRLMDLQQLSINQQNADSALMKYKREADTLTNNAKLLGGGSFSPPRPEALQSFNAPMNERNNNPGNLKDPGTGEFRQFSTPEEGALANLADLQLKISGGSDAMKARFGENYTPTLKSVLATWAPASDNNDPEKYAQFVSQKTGIPTDKPLAIEDAAKILPAIAQFEGGTNYNLPSALASLPVSPVQVGQTQTSAAMLPSTPQQGALANLPDFSVQEQSVEALKQIAQNSPTNENTAKYFEAQADLAKEKAKALKEIQDSEGKGKKELTEGEGALRKEFEGLPDVKDFRTVEASYQRLSNAAKKPSAAGDIAMIFNYMKMLDPGSTVREGEFATAQSAQGVPGQVITQYNKLLKGERLSPVQREDFVSQALGQYQAAEDLFNARAQQYEGVAGQYDYDPKRVIQGARGKTSSPSNYSLQDLLAEKARRGR